MVKNYFWKLWFFRHFFIFVIQDWFQMVINDDKWLQITVVHRCWCFWENSKTYVILKIFKKFGFFGSEGHVWGPITFFSRPRTTQGLHFKPIKSWANCVDMLTVENCLKHDKQRHLVSKMKFEIFFVLAQGQFHKLRIVFRRAIT